MDNIVDYSENVKEIEPDIEYDDSYFMNLTKVDDFKNHSNSLFHSDYSNPIYHFHKEGSIPKMNKVIPSTYQIDFDKWYGKLKLNNIIGFKIIHFGFKHNLYIPSNKLIYLDIVIDEIPHKGCKTICHSNFSILDIKINNKGNNYSNPTLSIIRTSDDGIEASAKAILDIDGTIKKIEMITNGTQYITDPIIKINDEITTLTDIVINILKTNPVKIHHTPHNFSNSTKIKITGVVGMTELNNNTYYLKVINNTLFELYNDSSLETKTNGTGFSSYTSDGIIDITEANGSGATAITEIELINNKYVIERVHIKESNSLNGYSPEYSMEVQNFYPISIYKLTFKYHIWDGINYKDIGDFKVLQVLDTDKLYLSKDTGTEIKYLYDTTITEGTNIREGVERILYKIDSINGIDQLSTTVMSDISVVIL